MAICVDGDPPAPDPDYATEQRLITLYAYEDPPFSESDNEHGGAGRSVDIVTNALDTTQTPYRLQMMPVRRGPVAVERRGQGCAFSYVSSEARQQKFHVLGPIQKGGWGFFTIKDPSGSHETLGLADVRRAPVLALSGVLATSDLHEEGYTVIEVPDSRTLLSALFAGRAAFAASGITTTGALAERYGFERPHMVSVWRQTDYFLLCSRDIPEPFIESWQRYFDSLAPAQLQ